MSFPVNWKKQLKEIKEKALAWSPFKDKDDEASSVAHPPAPKIKKEKPPLLSKSSPAIQALNAQLKKWREKLQRSIEQLRTSSSDLDPPTDSSQSNDASIHSLSESDMGDERFVSGYSYSNTDEESSSSASALRRPPYQVLTKDRMLKLQDHDIRQVSEMLDISRPFGRTLLMHFNWDAQKLLEVFFDQGKEQVYKGAGLRKSTRSPDAQSKQPFCCPVCLEEVDPEDTTSLSCGHCFCNSCWESYISLQVREGSYKKIHCMGRTKDGKPCSVIFNESKISDFLDEELYNKYSTKMLESYVEDNKRVKWCTSVPHCGRAIMLAPSQPRTIEVRCECGVEFCFNCGKGPHSPASCRMLAKWIRRTNEDAGTLSWLEENVKECPRCGASVYKTGGCNHVVCQCGQCFCWLCGQPTGATHTFDKIEGHTCGRFKIDRKVAEAAAAQASPDSIKRLQFYYERFKIHESACQLDDKALHRLRRKVLTMLTADLPLFQIKWFEHAVEKLLQCRRILAYSYVFCYFMFGDKEFYGDMSAKTLSITKTLFEDYQQQFELDLERLAALIDIPAKQIDENVCKTIISQTIIVDKRCRGLYDIIETNILPYSAHCTITKYISTTRGKSTLLVEPRLDFLAEAQKRTESTNNPSASFRGTGHKRKKQQFSHMPQNRSIRSHNSRMELGHSTSVSSSPATAGPTTSGEDFVKRSYVRRKSRLMQSKSSPVLNTSESELDDDINKPPIQPSKRMQIEWTLHSEPESEEETDMTEDLTPRDKKVLDGIEDGLVDELVSQLTDQGFGKNEAIEALQKAGNDISSALQILMNQHK